MMTIRSFASEPPEPTPPGRCPPGALEGPDAQTLLGTLSGKMAESIDGDADAYRGAIETCDCPDWRPRMTFGDVEIVREICALSLRLVRGRLTRVDEWVETEKEAQAALEGQVR